MIDSIPNELHLSLNKFSYGPLKFFRTYCKKWNHDKKKHHQKKTSKAVYVVQHIHTTKIKGENACIKVF